MHMGVCAYGCVCIGCVCNGGWCMHKNMNCVYAYPRYVYAYGVVCA